MAQLVIAAAGAAIGGALVPGAIALGVTGAQAGWIVGSLIGSSFAPAQKSQGPRLSDLSVSSSAYGTPIPYVQGSPRVAGQIVWASTKREVATTTRSGGKGGGKQKVTTYTYEVDLLILLTDNIIAGISRVWSNGKLVWNKSATSDSATKLASNTTAAWTRIAYYTGAASQLPDPTYEAAVGTSNAPAYRGRGSVFIQGLQLGSSGQIPNLTFEIGEEWSGDHPVDTLTRFQVAFAGSSSADVSAYATGSGSVNGGTLSEGAYTINLDGVSTLNRYILWTHADNFDVATGGTLTAEFFVTLSQDGGVNPAAATKFAQLTFGGTNNAIDFYVNGLSGGFNKLSLLRNASVNVHLGSGNAWGAHHFAITLSPDGFMRVYVDGIRTYEAVYTSDGSDGAVQLGGISVGFTSRYIAQFTGARVRRAIMYTGASFTPPSSDEVWGLP